MIQNDLTYFHIFALLGKEERECLARSRTLLIKKPFAALMIRKEYFLYAF